MPQYKHENNCNTSSLIDHNSFKNESENLVLQFGSEKNLLMDGMIWDDLLRTNFLTLCSAYLSPSSKLSSMPAALFSLVTLTQPTLYPIKKLS